MTLMNKIRNIALALGVATATLGAPKPAEAGGFLEVMAGHESAVLDLEMSADIGSKVNVYTRCQPALDYKGNANFFGLTDLNLGIVDGLSAVTEMQYGTGMTVIPRVGLNYFIPVGDAVFFGQATVALTDDPNYEFAVLASYRPKLKGDLHLVLSAETVTNVGNSGSVFALQKLRAGIGKGNVELTAAADLTETKDTFDYNVGGALRVRF